MSRWSALALLLLAVAGALALRVPELATRPLHNDEAVNAVKVSELWQQGRYAYDPDEYHGPTLHYATLPFLWLSGASNSRELNDATLRLAPVVFGAGLILLLWLLADGLGRPAVTWAAVFTAVSPAMVFYSRYFIHEMLLVFFTALTLGAGWRYAKGRSAIWAAVAGAGVGLMFATKETFVIPITAMAVAGVITAWWTMPSPRRVKDLLSSWRWPHVGWALGAAFVVWFLLFSSFFTHFPGLVDSARTYLPWLKRAGGHSPHLNPWSFYLERLAWFHPSPGPAWSEALILVLAVVGAATSLVRIFNAEHERAITSSPNTLPQHFTPPHEPPSTGALSAAVRGRGWFRLAQAKSEPGEVEPSAVHGPSTHSPENVEASPEPPLAWSPAFRRRGVRPAKAGTPCKGSQSRLHLFLVVYTAAHTAAYCVIPYKTPWCLLGFFHGMLLLAGVGAAALIDYVRSRWGKIGLVTVLLAATFQLSWQAWRASFVFPADRRNPYVYAQTVPDLLNLVQRAEGIARVAPAGYETVVKIIAPEDDYWPLPWYLRRFKHLGWYGKMPEDPYAPIVVVSSKLDARLDEKSDRKWIMAGLTEMRPGIYFELYVELELWKKYVETLPRERE